MWQHKIPPRKPWPGPNEHLEKDLEKEELMLALREARVRVAFYEGFLEGLAVQLEEPYKSKINEVLERGEE